MAETWLAKSELTRTPHKTDQSQQVKELNCEQNLAIFSFAAIIHRPS